MIVLRVEHEVHRHDGGAHGHQAEDSIDHQHEAVDIVELVGPEGREDEVHLDEDGAERQHSSGGDHEGRRAVPGRRGHGPGDAVHAAGRLVLADPVAAEDGARHGQRHGHEEPDGHHLQQHAQRDHANGLIGQRNEVQQGSHNDHNGGEQQDGGEHGALPLRADLRAHGGEVLLVVGAGGVAGHRGGQREAHDEGGHHLAAILVHVAVQQRSCHGVEDHSQHQHRELPARAD